MAVWGARCPHKNLHKDFYTSVGYTVFIYSTVDLYSTVLIYSVTLLLQIVTMFTCNLQLTVLYCAHAQ